MREFSLTGIDGAAMADKGQSTPLWWLKAIGRLSFVAAQSHRVD